MNTPRLLCPAGFSLGIPPANKPPSCGGPPEAIAEPADDTERPPPPPPPPPPPFGVSMVGPLRSLVVVFFNFLPA